MWRLTPIDDTARHTFMRCTSNSQTRRRERFQNNADHIENASNQFQALSDELLFHEMPATATNGIGDLHNHIFNDELESLYTDKLATEGQPGNEIYHKIRLLPQHNLCPLCGFRQISNLDHYLPKSKYPVLSVAPLNLVPVCRDCNFEKRDDVPLSESTSWLHPYFDNVQNVEWLLATVNHTLPPNVSYEVIHVTGWSTDLYSRVHAQFEGLGLADLYANEAGRLMRALSKILPGVFAEEGIPGVVKYLTRQRNAFKAINLNMWDGVMYAALAADNWYCSGGFGTFD